MREGEGARAREQEELGAGPQKEERERKRQSTREKYKRWARTAGQRARGHDVNKLKKKGKGGETKQHCWNGSLVVSFDYFYFFGDCARLLWIISW